MTIVVHNDLRRRVAAVTQGLTRVLIFLQASLQDIEGASRSGQFEVVALQTRFIVLDCLAIRNVMRGGELTWPFDAVNFDVWSMSPPEERDEATALMNASVEVQDVETVSAFVVCLKAFIHDTERCLGFADPLPVLRSPEGMFGAIRLARGAFEAVDELALPPLVPTEWMQPTSATTL